MVKTIWKISGNYFWAKSFFTATSDKNFSEELDAHCEEFRDDDN
jgi:hypothetical protein